LVGVLIEAFPEIRHVIGGEYSTWLILIGGFILFIGLVIAFRSGSILTKEQVADDWSVLIEDAQGKAEDVFKDTEQFIEESKAPDVRIRRERVAPGVVRSILGDRRDFLFITERGNPRLKPYQLFLNARDYGDNLDVSWYLTYRPTFWQSLFSLIPFVNLLPKGPGELDLFDQQDLRAYATNAHHCLLKAMEKLMREAGQDFSKIDRKSRGFLGIS
jgi:hypothetical protein